MKNLFNKRGTFTVFALMLFISIIICVGAIIKSAGDIAIGSTVNSFGTLWAKSILSEYDTKLKEKYGIFGFYGEKSLIESKLSKYIDYSFKEKEYIYYDVPACELDKYNLTDIDNLRQQIETISLESLLFPNEENYTEDSVDRAINAPWIIESLPSYEKTEKVYILELIEKIKAGVSIEDLKNNVAIHNYIFKYFKDYLNNKSLDKTYFRCEIEYIISGELSDSNAREECKSKIMILRNMLNLYYLYTCPQKRESAMILASTLTPGGAALLTQAVILEAWAYAEAENDLKILYDNKTVPLLKKDCNWALSLENLDENDEGYVMPETIEGIDYSNYLGILLCGLTEETALLRIMDLIQINMKYTYCDYFLLKDYYCGLSYELNVNGNIYEFKDTYIYE